MCNRHLVLLDRLVGDKVLSSSCIQIWLIGTLMRLCVQELSSAAEGCVSSRAKATHTAVLQQLDVRMLLLALSRVRLVHPTCPPLRRRSAGKEAELLRGVHDSHGLAYYLVAPLLEEALGVAAHHCRRRDIRICITMSKHHVTDRMD